MAGESSQIYSVQITGKCIFETFCPPLHDLIISPHLKHHPINLPKKVCSPMQSFFKKKFPPPLYFGGRGGGGWRHYALSSYLFPFLKVSSLTFAVQSMVFQAKLPSQCVFKVIQYGYEIFQAVLSLNFKSYS